MLANADNRFANIKAIITDIEGTTSSLSFVKETLFPYARERMATFISDHSSHEDVAPLLAAVREHCQQDAMSITAIINQLLAWIDADEKVTPLKQLQGMIWQAGYAQGDFKGHIYADAVDALRAWQGQGLMLCVYSSGSVQAQKLLFAHTAYGDLTPLFSAYFDTKTGGKKASDSYQAIAQAIDITPAQILFLSDIVAELDAANAAGLQACQLARPGEASAIGQHAVAASFAEIILTS